MSTAAVENGKDGADGKNGKNGKDGKDGTSCTVKPIEGGYKVLCDGDSVGVLLNGAKGDSGAQGIQGEDGNSAYELSGFEGSLEDWLKSLKGEDGKPCTTAEVTEGVELTCPGSEPVIIKNGENGTSCDIVSDKDGVVTIKCGTDANAKTTTLYKAMCGTTPYDPAEKFCDDRDYQTYKFKTISVGDYSEIWMVENLNYATAVIGTDSSSFCYGDGFKDVEDRGAENCAKYGRLYTWAAAVGKTEAECGFRQKCNLGVDDIQGVCPNGWHLPSKTEWETLIDAVGGMDNAGKALKSKEGWKDYTGIENNDTYGFTALPGGMRLINFDTGKWDGDYLRKEQAFFWTSTEEDAGHANTAYLFYDKDMVDVASTDKVFGHSVRCIKGL
jgi:uncharacterized protein (TIGR02145 family)